MQRVLNQGDNPMFYKGQLVTAVALVMPALAACSGDGTGDSNESQQSIVDAFGAEALDGAQFRLAEQGMPGELATLSDGA